MLRPTLPYSRWHYKMSEPCYPKVSILMSHLLRTWWFSFTPNCKLLWRIAYMSRSLLPFGYHMSTFLFMCGSTGRHLVISSSYHTNILFIIDPLSHSIMYLFWLATSYSVHLSRCECGHTIDDLSTHLL
jgi:hypothetical protein